MIVIIIIIKNKKGILIVKKIYKSSVMTERLVPKYTRQLPWLAFGICLILCGNSISQDLAYNAPDVNIYESPEQDFELPGSGDYIPSEQIQEYNFQNINDILRNSTGVYSREEGGYGLFPNISLRGVSSLRSAAVTMLEDGINIAPCTIFCTRCILFSLSSKDACN